MRPGPPEPLPPGWPLADAAHTAEISPYRWHVNILGDGPDMLILHGAGASSHSWAGLAPLLGGDYRLIIPDLPGHGLTRARGMRASLEAMTQDLAALLRGLSSRPRILLGHSAGGALALALGQKLDPKPNAVIVLNGALENFQGLAGVMFPIMAKMLALNPFAAPLLARQAGQPGSVERVIRSTGTKLPPEAIAPYRHLIADRRHVAGTLAMMAAWRLDGLARMMPQIDLPVLFLHGEGDEAVRPDVARRAAARLPNAKLQILDGLGHLIQEEDPARVHRCITAFLADACVSA